MHRLQTIRAREAAKAEAKRQEKLLKDKEQKRNRAGSVPKKINVKQDEDHLPHYKRVRNAVDELRNDLREKVRDKIDTVIKFEVEHARKPKE